MRRKYHGIITIALLLLLLLGVGGYYKSGLWQKTSVISGTMQPLTTTGWVPSEEQVKQMQRLLPMMSQLAVPSPRKNAPSPLYLFGQRAPRNGGHGTYAAEVTQPTYRLSLTLLAGPLRYCIVNGAFVSEGGQLADGAAVVKKIDNQRVLIANERQLEWIYLQDPTQTTPGAESLPFTSRKDKS